MKRWKRHRQWKREKELALDLLKYGDWEYLEEKIADGTLKFTQKPINIYCECGWVSEGGVFKLYTELLPPPEGTYDPHGLDFSKTRKCFTANNHDMRGAPYDRLLRTIRN